MTQFGPNRSLDSLSAPATRTETSTLGDPGTTGRSPDSHPECRALLLRRCQTCREFLPPMAARCPCGSDKLRPCASAGRGIVISSRIVYCTQREHGPRTYPRVLAIAALDEGPWIFCWLAVSVASPERWRRICLQGTDTGDRFPLFGLTETTNRLARNAAPWR